MKDKSARRSERRCTPAFLTDTHRGLHEPTTMIRTTPTLPTAANKALGLLPKLTAEIGFAMAGRENVNIEILPDTPTTVAFTSGGKLVSLLVLPFGADQARKLVGLSPLTKVDLLADQLWEEQREVLTPENLLSELPTWEL